MHDPEAEPEHEVARGQDVEEDHQAGRHHSVPRPVCPPSPSMSPVSDSGSGVCVSGSGRVITVTTGRWLLVTSVLCTVHCTEAAPVTHGDLQVPTDWGVAPVSVWNKMQY